MSKLFRGNKYLVNACAFCTCLFVVICLFLSGINVLGADGDYDFKSLYDIEKPFLNSDFESDDLPIPWFAFDSVNSRGYTKFVDLLNNNLLSIPTSDDYFDYSFNYCFIGYEDVNYTFYANNLPDGSFITVVNDTSGFCIYAPADSFEHINYSDDYIYSVDTSYARFNDSGFIQFQNQTYATVEIDGVRYARWYTGRNNNLAYSNLPIYPWTSFWSDPSSLGDLGAQVNPNYHETDMDTIEDNINFDPAFMFIDCDKNFKGDGLVTSLGMNQSQVNAFNGADWRDYYGIWDYSLNVTIGNISGSYTSSYKNYLKFFNNGRFNMNMAEILVTMESGNGDNAWSFMKDFQFMTTEYNILDYDYSIGVNTDNFSLGGTIPIQLSVGNYMSQCDFHVTFTPKHIDVGSRSITFNYDFLTGVFSSENTFKTQNDVYNDVNNYNKDNGLSLGDDNYKDIRDYQYNLPASNNYPAVSGGSVSNSTGGSSNATGGTGYAYGGNATVGNIVITNGGDLIDPKPVIDYVDNNLLPITNDNNFVDKLENGIQSNGFLQVMSNTFTFVPESVWNDLAFYFNIFLGMLVGFFGLRLILDIL